MKRFVAVTMIASAFALGALAQTGTKPAPKPTTPPAATAPAHEKTDKPADAKKKAGQSQTEEKPAPKPKN